MKKIILILFLISSTLSAKESLEPLRVYLCSRLTPAARAWNDKVCEELYSEYRLFRPQDLDLNNLPTLHTDWAVYQADLEGMQGADLLLVLPPYGRDCSWEIGWFCGKNKPAIAYAENSGDWIKDAMVKGGLTAIITNDPNLFSMLLSDPATQHKCYLIPSKSELPGKIREIYLQQANAAIKNAS